MADRIFAAYWIGVAVGACAGAVIGYGLAEVNASPAPALSHPAAYEQAIRLPPVSYGSPDGALLCHNGDPRQCRLWCLQDRPCKLGEAGR